MHECVMQRAARRCSEANDTQRDASQPRLITTQPQRADDQQLSFGGKFRPSARLPHQSRARASPLGDPSRRVCKLFQTDHRYRLQMRACSSSAIAQSLTDGAWVNAAHAMIG
ncbi:hypothetical protein [Xanthomonas campestris]|uniref:hypothetical protein n=1 Tax=Xanthomonas campestris TaxID=339 RepID=UPI002B232E9D|nr:hypothetical protein [Xanthomonas campestris]MEA9674351.1 hypothetical protein [Xanthomonas campestris pv. raphani]MEA9773621.1 hypothetical protein [Xanthomonas campestris pv. raphani]MEA9916518.1 hypothetical protein [Xanthomonas campestris pv. raphani]